MIYLRTRSASTALLLAFAMLLSLPFTGVAQTFRGGISGAVTDPSGAAVAGAQVTAVETATNVFYKAITSSAGEFAFVNLPLGSYSVTVKAEKFQPTKFDNIPVTAGVTYTFPIKLSVATSTDPGLSSRRSLHSPTAH